MKMPRIAGKIPKTIPGVKSTILYFLSGSGSLKWVYGVRYFQYTPNRMDLNPDVAYIAAGMPCRSSCKKMPRNNPRTKSMGKSKSDKRSITGEKMVFKNLAENEKSWMIDLAYVRRYANISAKPVHTTRYRKTNPIINNSALLRAYAAASSRGITTSFSVSKL